MAQERRRPKNGMCRPGTESLSRKFEEVFFILVRAPADSEPLPSFERTLVEASGTPTRSGIVEGATGSVPGSAFDVVAAETGAVLAAAVTTGAVVAASTFIEERATTVISREFIETFSTG